MDLDKFAMLKATVKQVDYISVIYIDSILNVDDEEAKEMLSKLIQAGLVEAYPIDGINYKVRK